MLSTSTSSTGTSTSSLAATFGSAASAPATVRDNGGERVFLFGVHRGGHIKLECEVLTMSCQCLDIRFGS
jgi:hypothetical protein